MARKSNLHLLRATRPHRIGIIKPSAFGDVVQSIPLLPALRKRFPAGKISWVINRGLVPLVSQHPALDDVIPFDRHGGWRGWKRLLVHLRRAKFDLVFDLQGLFRTAVMTRATGAKVRVGLETAREGSHFACNVTIPNTGRDVPAYARYWRVAEALGLGSEGRHTELVVSPVDQVAVERLLNDLPRPVIAMHAGARWETKRWPPENFAAIANRALDRFGGSTILIGSTEESPLADAIEASIGKLNRVRNLCGKTSLKQLGEVLRRVDLLFCNDSGPMHLAAGLGTPVCGVFTCTSPIRSGPPPAGHALVATQLPCAAGYHKRCPQRGEDHLACFSELTVDRVWQQLARLLQPRRAA